MNNNVGIPVICDFDLDDNTIKIPKTIDIEEVKYLIRVPVTSYQNIKSLDNYTILRTDDNYVHVSPNVGRLIGVSELDGDIIYCKEVK